MVIAEPKEIIVKLPLPHSNQEKIIKGSAKRKIIRAGRRSGKTVCAAIIAVKAFLDGKRILYTAPTSEQVETFWFEIKRALAELIAMGIFAKNETEHVIQKENTENRIQARTAWSADMIRGSYADFLIMDEYQLCSEDLWEVIGAPMMLDRAGSAIIIYTPPSLRSAGISKAHDPRHAAKMFKTALSDTTGLWQAFHFTSFDNPYISKEGLQAVFKDMSKQAYRQEILAEDDELQMSWLVYKAFNESICRIKRFEIPPPWLVYSGHDFGAANPAALFFAQVKLPLPPGAPPYMRMNDLVCFKEYLPGGMGAPQHVSAFKEIVGRRVVKSVGGNATTEEQTRQLYGMHGWPIQAPAITHINAQIDRVVGLMELNKVYCFEDNIYWLEELMNCLWTLDQEGSPTNKVKDEARYHLCFVAGTKVRTIAGEKPIEDIRLGDLVATRKGYYPVIGCGITQIAETITAKFSNGSELRGTGDHPIWIKEKGFVPLTSIRYNDIVEIWKKKQFSTKAQNTTDTLKLKDVVTGPTLSQDSVISIASFGKMLLGRYLLGMLSTIGTLTHSIMNWQISNVRGMVSICQSIWWENSLTLELCTQSKQKQSGGLSGYPQRVKEFAPIMHAKLWEAAQLSNYGVSSAVKNLLIKVSSRPSSALINVSRHIGGLWELIMRRDIVKSVVRILQLTDMLELRPAPVHVVGVFVNNKATVYNLTIDTVHEYFANGILVSNCACCRYILSSFMPETVDASWGRTKFPRSRLY